MVFSHLPAHEKQAFFDLLDEYFSSRPDLLNSTGASSGADPPAADKNAAYSAVRSALASNPEATSSLISAGLKHGAANSSSVKNSAFASAASDPTVANSIGRVAAASLAFGRRETNPPPPAPRGMPPPPAPRNAPPVLPRRTSSQAEQEQEQEEAEAEEQSALPPGRPPVPTRKTGGAPGLKIGRSFGDVDTTSWKAGFSTLRHGTVNKSKSPPPVAPPLPSALPKRQNNFPPPPPRRATSDSPPAARTPSPEPEPEEEGEWMEALYEYNSGEAGDLVINAQDRIKVLSKDSDDWWTGEIDGRTGLFPASYVKAL